MWRVFSIATILCLAVAPPAAAAAAEWGTCPWAVDPAQQRYYDVRCVTLRVPLDYSNAKSPLINFHVTQLRHKAIPQTKAVPQLWFLNGGPGTPGEWLLPALAIPGDTPTAEVEYLLPAHRGTGLSHELQCPDGSQSISQCCIDQLRRNATVRLFTVSNAARDLYTGIGLLRAAGPVFVLGTSYGTLWLNRLLTMYPAAPIAGAVLDSVVDPAAPHFWRYDAEASGVAVEFLRRCEADPDCAPLWQGKGMAEAFRETVTQIAFTQQRCVRRHFPYLNIPEGADRLKAYVLFPGVFQSVEFYNRRLVPAVIYRLRRCTASDVTALGRFFDTIPQLRDPTAPTASPSGAPAFVRQSKVLNALIHLSENFNPPNRVPSLEAVELLNRNALFSTGAAIRIARYREAGFPTYRTDEFAYKLADPKCPVLMMNGDLDVATLVGYVEAIHSKRPNWYFRPLRNVGHSPVAMVGIGVTCVARILLSFLANPAVDPYLSDPCAAQLPAAVDCNPEGSVSAAVAQAAFGTDDLYGLRAAGSPSPVSPSPRAGGPARRVVPPNETAALPPLPVKLPASPVDFYP
eukprot:EG_transcript_6485